MYPAAQSPGGKIDNVFMSGAIVHSVPMKNRKVVIAGGSGRLGQLLSGKLISAGYDVTVLSRNPDRTAKFMSPGVATALWAPYSGGPWSRELESSYAIINLSGADIFAKWNESYKKEIVDSRVMTTANVVKALEKLEVRPEVFINASASGIYGYDSISSEELTEKSEPADDFFGKLVQRWEAEASAAEDLGIRTAMVRTSVVLSMKGGALPELYRLFRRHMGSYIRPGNQWIPWIHILDEVSVFKYLMEDPSIRGPVNACTENPVTMRVLAQTLGKVMNRRVNFGIPQFMIKLIMGEVSMLVTKGKKVMPAVLKEKGFEFQFPTLEGALRNLVSRDSY